jgi:hypothetical protein
MDYAGVHLQLLPKFHVNTREIMGQVDRIDLIHVFTTTNCV